MLEVRTKKPVSFGIKVALSVLVITIIVVGLKKYLSAGVKQEPNITDSAVSVNRTILIPQLFLNVSLDKPESEWIFALAEVLAGATEVKVDRGRVDVVTDKYAIEVDFLSKWKEGLGQAIHYGYETDLLSTLAVITDELNALNSADKDLIKKIEELCLSKGVKLLLLHPKKVKSS